MAAAAGQDGKVQRLYFVQPRGGLTHRDRRHHRLDLLIPHLRLSSDVANPLNRSRNLQADVGKKG
jgi:hypothetical protein